MCCAGNALHFPMQCEMFVAGRTQHTKRLVDPPTQLDVPSSLHPNENPSDHNFPAGARITHDQTWQIKNRGKFQTYALLGDLVSKPESKMVAVCLGMAL
jgi:hypothetical protein